MKFPTGNTFSLLFRVDMYCLAWSCVVPLQHQPPNVPQLLNFHLGIALASFLPILE